MVRADRTTVPGHLRALLAAALCLPGCTIGVNQLAMYPAIGGQYDFSGARAQVTGPADIAGNPFEFAIDLPARKGQVQPIAGMPQLSLGLDTPSWRLTANPSFTGSETVEHFQLDLYYKHLLSRGRHASWRILGGISYANLSTQIEETGVLQLNHPIEIGGARLQDGDKIVYRSSATDSGVYLGAGLELELSSWLHLFAMVQMRLNSSQGADEQLEVIARDGSTWDEDGVRQEQRFNVFDDGRFDTKLQSPGKVTSTLSLPPMVALIGIAFTFPTWTWMRHTFNNEPRPPPPTMWLPPRVPPYGPRLPNPPPATRPPSDPAAPAQRGANHPPPATPYPGG